MDSGVYRYLFLPQHTTYKKQFPKIWNADFHSEKQFVFALQTYFPYNQVAVRLVDVVVVKLFVLLVIVEPGVTPGFQV